MVGARLIPIGVHLRGGPACRKYGRGYPSGSPVGGQGLLDAFRSRFWCWFLPTSLTGPSREGRP